MTSETDLAALNSDLDQFRGELGAIHAVLLPRLRSKAQYQQGQLDKLQAATQEKDDLQDELNKLKEEHGTLQRRLDLDPQVAGQAEFQDKIAELQTGRNVFMKRIVALRSAIQAALQN